MLYIRKRNHKGRLFDKIACEYLVPGIGEGVAVPPCKRDSFYIC